MRKPSEPSLVVITDEVTSHLLLSFASNSTSSHPLNVTILRLLSVFLGDTENIRSAPVCAGLRRSAPVRAGLRRFAPVRAGLRRSILKIFVNRKFRLFIKKLSSGESRIVFSKEEPRTQRSFLERNARER